MIAILAVVAADIVITVQVVREDGLVVTQLLPGAPAEHGGLREGDVLLGVNGRVFGSDPQAELGAAIAAPNPIVLKVRRRADVKDVTVTPTAAK